MSVSLKSLAGCAAVLVTAATLGAATAAPAQATIQDCATYGFVNISYNQAGGQQSSVGLGSGRSVGLLTTLVSSTPGRHAFAKITGSTRPGDQVWLDWSTTGGNGHIQCGPFSVQSTGSPNTSAAKILNPGVSGWVFRACGKIVGGSTKCTGWNDLW
ncbi:hypothetical protein OG339_37710 [Streptosporangium sp. NBC_01495]|uniref:hypothetical protein n=1 Tax=Streptosporangium sp. NBC_01495 TaxID=2903899 RepID=UPI002E30ED38|nr:hypothetical protein [Streptosporangium sp. NBC_01495]